MDGSIFDRFAQAVGGSSRRLALRSALGGATLGAAGLLASAAGGNAKKKKCKKKKCKKCESLDAGAPCTSNKDCCSNETNLNCALANPDPVLGDSVCCGGLGAACEGIGDCCIGFVCSIDDLCVAEAP